MKHKYNLCVNARLLAMDPQTLKRVSQILKELEEKGFLTDGVLTFEETEEEDVKDIFNKPE